MSLLQLKDESREDPSAKGEDYAKGSSFLLWTTIAAAIIVSVSIFSFVWSSRKPPVAAGEVTQVWAHAVHTINTPKDANGEPTPGQVFDQILVLSNVRIRNQSDQPIVLREMMTNITLEDGIHSSYAAGPVDYDRIFIAYPKLASLRSRTLVPDTVVQPSQTVEGMLISSFHLSEKDWAVRRDLNISIAFKFHPELVLTPTGPVSEL